jgi:transcriptional regulator with XRE-family HTH domain
VRIIRLLDESGLTDREVGERIGVSQQSVNRWRRGEQVPGVERAAVLADALGVSEATLTAAIVDDLKQRTHAGDPAGVSIDRLLSAASRIAARNGVAAMTPRAIAEACLVPITDLARLWRTRDDLTRAVLDHALRHATKATLATTLAAHLDTIARLGPSKVWTVQGMYHAADLAGGHEALARLVGAALIGEPPATTEESGDRSDRAGSMR